MVSIFANKTIVKRSLHLPVSLNNNNNNNTQRRMLSIILGLDDSNFSSIRLL